MHYLLLCQANLGQAIWLSRTTYVKNACIKFEYVNKPVYLATSELALGLLQIYWYSKYTCSSSRPQSCTVCTAKKKRPGYLVGNLVATNWPIEKALHAIGYNQIPTK